MQRPQLEHIIRAAAGITGTTEIVVIESQAVLGQFPNAPAELLFGITPMASPKKPRFFQPVGKNASSGCKIPIPAMAVVSVSKRMIWPLQNWRRVGKKMLCLSLNYCDINWSTQPKSNPACGRPA